MPNDGAKLTPPIEHVTKSVQDFPVRVLTSWGTKNEIATNATLHAE